MKQVDTILLVKNIEETKLFYKNVLNLNVLHDWESMVVYENRLAIHQADLLQPQELIKDYISFENLEKSNVIIYLETENLAFEYNRMLELDVDVIHGIVDLPWQKIFRIKENNGYIVEIGEEKKN